MNRPSTEAASRPRPDRQRTWHDGPFLFFLSGGGCGDQKREGPKFVSPPTPHPTDGGSLFSIFLPVKSASFILLPPSFRAHSDGLDRPIHGWGNLDLPTSLMAVAPPIPPPQSAITQNAGLFCRQVAVAQCLEAVTNERRRMEWK